MSHVSPEMDAAPEPGADADLGTPAVDQAPEAETGWAAPDPAWPGADLELAEPTEFDPWPHPEAWTPPTAEQQAQWDIEEAVENARWRQLDPNEQIRLQIEHAVQMGAEAELYDAPEEPEAEL